MWGVNCRDKHKSADDDGKHMGKSSSAEEVLRGFSHGYQDIPRFVGMEWKQFSSFSICFPTADNCFGYVDL